MAYNNNHNKTPSQYQVKLKVFVIINYGFYHQVQDYY